MKKRHLVYLAARLMTLRVAGAAQAAAISYEGTLFDGIGNTGQVSIKGEGFEPSSALSDYWTFHGNQGDVATITVRRDEGAFDPALFIFERVFTDDSVFGSGLIGGNVRYLDFADDELPPAISGPWGDPIVTLTLPVTAAYTAVVTDGGASDSSGDG